MEWWHVYLFTRLDSIKNILDVATTCTGIASLVAGILWAWSVCQIKDTSGCESWRKGWEPWVKTYRIAFKSSLPVFLLALSASIAIPTQKEAAAIYLLPKLAHSDFAKEAQQLPTDAAKLMRMKLESWIADMEPKKQK